MSQLTEILSKYLSYQDNNVDYNIIDLIKEYLWNPNTTCDGCHKVIESKTYLVPYCDVCNKKYCQNCGHLVISCQICHYSCCVNYYFLSHKHSAHYDRKLFYCFNCLNWHCFYCKKMYKNTTGTYCLPINK